MATCIVCKQNITPETGIQCQDSLLVDVCSAWVHYSCLDYVTDDVRKMMHEPYINDHIYSDVTKLNNNDKNIEEVDVDKNVIWSNNYDSDPELPDNTENQCATITTKIKLRIQSKSAPLSALPQAILPADDLKTKESVAVVTDKMVENVPIEVACQTFKTECLPDVNYAFKSTNTSVDNSVALLVSKSVGSYNSKLSPSADLKILDTAKNEKDTNNCLGKMDAPSCPQEKNKRCDNKSVGNSKTKIEAPSCPQEKSKRCENKSVGNSKTKIEAPSSPQEKSKRFENKSVGNSKTKIDASVSSQKSLDKDNERILDGHIYNWTKLDATKLPDEIRQHQINKVFGKLLPCTQNPEEIDEPSSHNVLTSCMKNVLSTFEMLSSQICDIFCKKEYATNYCSTVRSEGVLSIVRKNYTSSNVFEKKHECLTVKLLTFQNE